MSTRPNVIPRFVYITFSAHGLHERHVQHSLNDVSTGQYINTVSISTSSTDTNSDDNTATIDFTIWVDQANVRISKDKTIKILNKNLKVFWSVRAKKNLKVFLVRLVRPDQEKSKSFFGPSGPRKI